MPQPRTFDYDYLRELLREHPDWNRHQVAAAVTEHEREVRHDPGYPHINVASIATVLYRYRDTWAELGDRIPARPHDPTRRSQPFRNVPKEYRYLGPIQNLRRLTQLARGEYVNPVKAREAQAMAKRLDNEKSVVDLDYRGRPYIRKARPDELDQTGSLISYAALYPGLTDAQWEALGSAEMRAAASEQWRS